MNIPSPLMRTDGKRITSRIVRSVNQTTHEVREYPPRLSARRKAGAFLLAFCGSIALCLLVVGAVHHG
jgi:hypothetical protein